MKHLYSSRIIIPSCFKKINDKNDTLNLNLPHKKLIIYKDSLNCNSCDINKMYLWKEYSEYTKTLKGSLKLYFIFHTHKDMESDLLQNLKNSFCEYPIYLDLNGDFEKLNPHLPKNKAMHTFLLDENNKVILVGNPLYNKEIEKLLYKIMQEKLGK